MSDFETPSQSIINNAPANKTVEIKDSLGRVLTVKHIGVLEQARIYKAMGSQHSTNPPYTYMVFACASCVKIDGRPITFPLNERLIEAALTNLGDEGLTAIMIHMEKEVKKLNEAAEVAQAEANEEDYQSTVDAPNPLVKSAS